MSISPKYEKGVDRISASRLHQIANVLKVPPSFFFDDAPAGKSRGEMPTVVNQSLSTKDGLALAKAYMAIDDKAVRRRIIELVAQVSGDHTPDLDGPKLALFLLSPHPKMPDMGLSRTAAGDLAAYISSLK